MIEPPQELTDTAAELRAATGVEPKIENIDLRKWRLSMRNARVYMEVDYRTAQRGRVTWLRSALYVDGERRPLASNPEHFVRIFLDPDTEAGPTASADPRLPEADPRSAPAIVQHFYAKLARALGVQLLHIGRDGRHWQIAIDGERGAMRFRFIVHGRKVGTARPWIQVIVDGVDRSAETSDNLENALALFTSSGDAPAAPGTDGATAKETGFGAVGIRRHSVMRN